MQNSTSNVQETEEDQRQTRSNISNYCTIIVNSFNIHSSTLENCHNNNPVTRSSVFPSTSVPIYNLNIAICY